MYQQNISIQVYIRFIKEEESIIYKL